MPLDHRTEVAEVVGAEIRLAQFDFGDDDGTPFLGLSDWLSSLIEDRREHPAVSRLHECAADDVNMILTSASFRKLFKRATAITPGDYRERYRLRPH